MAVGEPVQLPGDLPSVLVSPVPLQVVSLSAGEVMGKDNPAPKMAPFKIRKKFLLPCLCEHPFSGICLNHNGLL